jgi:hypothetical protein
MSSSLTRAFNVSTWPAEAGRSRYSGRTNPTHYRKLQDLPVEKKVHSIAIDDPTHRVHTPEEQEQGKPVARMIAYEPVTISDSKK